LLKLPFLVLAETLRTQDKTLITTPSKTGLEEHVLPLCPSKANVQLSCETPAVPKYSIQQLRLFNHGCFVIRFALVLEFLGNIKGDLAVHTGIQRMSLVEDKVPSFLPLAATLLLEQWGSDSSRPRAATRGSEFILRDAAIAVQL
jgi:hypothetical protein